MPHHNFRVEGGSSSRTAHSTVRCNLRASLGSAYIPPILKPLVCCFRPDHAPESRLMRGCSPGLTMTSGGLVQEGPSSAGGFGGFGPRTPSPGALVTRGLSGGAPGLAPCVALKASWSMGLPGSKPGMMMPSSVLVLSI